MGEENQSEATGIQNLNVEQLRGLSKQLKESIAQLNKRNNQLELASMKFNESKKAVKTLEESKEGDSLMAPLTTSMYVPAALTNTSTVTVELGSGFYVKKSTEKAVEFFNRKISFCDKSSEQISKQMMNATNNLEQVHAVLNLRLREQTENLPRPKP